MSIFTAGRLLLQSISDDEMFSLATIARFDEGDGSYGSGSSGYVQIATDVPCRVGRSETSENEMIDVTGDNQLKSVIEYLLSFPVGTDVQATDRVTLDDGRVFDVAGSYANIQNLAMTSVVANEST